MLLLVIISLSLCCSLFFYIQAFISGLGRKCWAVAGLLFGPIIWPMFALEKRMYENRLFGLNDLIFRA